MKVGQVAVYGDDGYPVSKDPRKISSVAKKQVNFERGRDGYAYPRRMSKENIFGVFDTFEEADAAIEAAYAIQKAMGAEVVAAERRAVELRDQMSAEMQNAVRDLAAKQS